MPWPIGQWCGHPFPTPEPPPRPSNPAPAATARATFPAPVASEPDTSAVVPQPHQFATAPAALPSPSCPTATPTLLMRERTPKLIPSVITVKIADFHAHTWPRQGNPQFSRKGESSGTGGKEGRKPGLDNHSRISNSFTDQLNYRQFYPTLMRVSPWLRFRRGRPPRSAANRRRTAPPPGPGQTSLARRPALPFRSRDRACGAGRR